MKILNLGDMPANVAGVLDGSDDEAVDPHLNRIKNAREGGAGGDVDSDEEDEDFIAEKDDAGSPTDDSDEEGSDASEDGDGESAKEPRRKEPAAAKPAVKKKKRDEGEDDGKKKKRKKKDPNAPKRAMSSFMYFSQAERERLKKTNPGLPFTEVAKVVGERWKKMSEEEKEPYEAHAKRDKTRYTAEMAEYRSGKGASGPIGEQSSDEASE